MFQKLPGAVRRACRLTTAKVLRKILEDLVQCEVRLASLQEPDDLFTNRIVHMYHLTLNEDLYFTDYESSFHPNI